MNDNLFTLQLRKASRLKTLKNLVKEMAQCTHEQLTPSLVAKYMPCILADILNELFQTLKF